ncbi:MAG: hypothetical protein ACFFCS_28670 [Candidatus Hodarchaeota archaeon]
MLYNDDCVPNWSEIKIITDELRDILDDVDEIDDLIPNMRYRLATTIASMRADKVAVEMKNKGDFIDLFGKFLQMMEYPVACYCVKC